jgi:LytS/YehU family sensor histidine kinase
LAKEEVLNDQTKARFASYKYEQQVALANSQKMIADDQLKIEKQKLEQQSLQKEFLIVAIIGLILIGGFTILSIVLRRRNEKQKLEHEIEVQKLEREKTTAELQHQAVDLKMQALRAQMSPHFIFNSLNSINMFILENNKLQASEYLSKFSRLVRLILENSQEALIPLERELEALALYLELESLRFQNKFEYKISTVENFDPSEVKVPPLIIQPYVENAIWHGLMHKKDKGHLDVQLAKQEDFLVCKIIDDGVGRKKAAEMKNGSSKHRSMGFKITESRIANMQMNGTTQSVEIEDLVSPDGSAAGTEVILKIPLLN